MFDTLCYEFDYVEEAIDRLEKLYKLEKETLLCTYENSLEYIKSERKNYLAEKKMKISQGKSIRINRKQQSNKWNKLKLAYFQNNLQIKMHPS